ncbi:hypothetical protein [Methylosinus sp. LW3]|uniref:hypothetical protein n=1 Tax=Methylosinus sp. LW3 TaxID=107635 RepID=UPI0004644C6A|nr:hypothetical protein [Methylosinus sp. LW3]
MIIPDLATFAQVSTEYHAALASVTKAEKTAWRQTLQLAIKSHLAEPLPDVTPQMLYGGCDLLAELLADPHQRRMLHQRGAATLEFAKAPDMRPRDLFVTLREREPELEQALTAQGLIRHTDTRRRGIVCWIWHGVAAPSVIRAIVGASGQVMVTPDADSSGAGNGKGAEPAQSGDDASAHDQETEPSAAAPSAAVAASETVSEEAKAKVDHDAEPDRPPLDGADKRGRASSGAPTRGRSSPLRGHSAAPQQAEGELKAGPEEQKAELKEDGPAERVTEGAAQDAEASTAESLVSNLDIPASGAPDGGAGRGDDGAADLPEFLRGD